MAEEGVANQAANHQRAQAEEIHHGADLWKRYEAELAS